MHVMSCGDVMCRSSIAAAADYVEEQWRFYGFCDSFEQARYIAAQGLSAGLGELLYSCKALYQACQYLLCLYPQHVACCVYMSIPSTREEVDTQHAACCLPATSTC